MDQNVDDGVNQDSSLDTRGRNILEEFSLMNTKALKFDNYVFKHIRLIRL